MLIDNKKYGKVGDVLRQHLHKDGELAVTTDSFSLYAFQSLQKELEKSAATRLIISDASIYTEGSHPALSGGRYETRLKNQLLQKVVATQCAGWLKKKAQVRAASNAQTISQNMFHVQGADDAVAIQGSSSFTSEGLGYVESDRHHMNMALTDSESTKVLLE